MRIGFKSKVFMILLGAIYKLVLEWSYISFVNNFYAYAGFDLSFVFTKYVSSWLMFIFISFFVPTNINRPSNYFFMSAYLFLLAPLIVFYGLAGKDIYPVLISVFSIGLIYFLTSIKGRKSIRFTLIENGRFIGLIISLLFVLLLIGWYFLSGAVRYFNLDLTKVYEFRADSAELASVGVMAYINNWVYKVFIIYAISWSLLKKKYGLTTFLISVQVFFFGVSAHKSVLFTPLVILSIWWYFRKFKTLLVMPVGFLIFVIFSSLSYHLFNNIIISSLFVRRLLFVPAKLTYNYIDFFSNNEYVFWSNSFLSFFLEYKYLTSISLLIGDFEGSGAAANNGFISSGYAHAGLLGVVLYSIIIAFLLRMLNYSVQKGVPVWFALAMVITPLRDTLISSDLLTTLLTHGLLVSFALLLLSVERRKLNYDC